MNKKIVTTDTHLGLKHSKQFWLNLTKEYFGEIIAFCIENDIKSVLHLGDFFHVREHVNLLAMSYAYIIAEMFRKNEIEFKIILGNHDCYYDNIYYPNSLALFQKYDNIKIIDEKPERIGDMVYIPWGSSLVEGKYAFGHFDINDFYMNSHYVQKKGKFKPEDFSNYEKVFSGHFHTRSKKGNIEYIGSGFPMTFNDINQRRGFYVFENGKMEFHHFTSAPEFVIIPVINGIEDIKEDNVKGNIVRLVFMKDFGTNENGKIIDNTKTMEPVELYKKFEALKKDEEISIEDVEIKKNPDILFDFIEEKQLPDNINKKVLKQIIINFGESYV